MRNFLCRLGAQITFAARMAAMALLISPALHATSEAPCPEETVRAGSVVFCNQSSDFLLNSIALCVGQIKNSLGVPEPGNSAAHSKLDIIESTIDVIDSDLSTGNTILCSKILRIESAVDNLKDTNCAYTFIESLPYIISTPGLYALAANLNWNTNGAAITINADNVILDLRCYELSVVSGSALRTGIMNNGNNVLIDNGFMRLIESGTAETNLITVNGVSDTTIRGTGFTGPLLEPNMFRHIRVAAGSINPLIEDCSFLGSRLGIDCDNAQRIKIERCFSNGASYAHINLTDACSNVDINSCQFMLGSLHINIDSSSQILISDCRLDRAGTETAAKAISIVSSDAIIVKDCCIAGTGVIDDETFVAGSDACYVEDSTEVSLVRLVALEAADWGINIVTSSKIKMLDCSINSANLNGGTGGISDPNDTDDILLGCCVGFSTPSYAVGASFSAIIAEGETDIGNANSRWINIGLP